MNNHKPAYDYGTCPTCGEQMEEKTIKQDFRLKEKLIVVESVPAGACPRWARRS
jgi:YgiT-type zinc finger domain-containing protein